MTAPAFNDYWNPAYDLYSVPVEQFSVPLWWDIYLPDPGNNVDYQCRSVIVPNPALGARRWTLNGDYICLGIYRDEGRPNTAFPTRSGLSWIRLGLQLVINDPAGHGLKVGETVNVANVNVASLPNATVTNVYNAQQFVVQTYGVGLSNGDLGSYQPTRTKSFYEENLVFRLLPSFKLVPYATVAQLFSESAPLQDYSTRYLWNLTTDQPVMVPRVRNQSVDYSTLESKLRYRGSFNSDRRFNQAFDEAGEELQVEYNSYGFPVFINQVDSPYSNTQVRLNSPRAKELPLPDESPDADDKPYVYDFYGFEINDPARGPYFASDLITRDPSVDGIVNNLLRKGNAGQPPFYSSKFVNDVFGNWVIGIQENNATVVREPVLPLSLDAFNRPNKAPFPRNVQ